MLSDVSPAHAGRTKSKHLARSDYVSSCDVLRLHPMLRHRISLSMTCYMHSSSALKNLFTSASAASLESLAWAIFFILLFCESLLPHSARIVPGAACAESVT